MCRAEQDGGYRRIEQRESHREAGRIRADVAGQRSQIPARRHRGRHPRLVEHSRCAPGAGILIVLAGQGTFNLCSFWYVEALTRAGRVREARMIFEKMLTYANHLGLYAEQIGASGEALGNFPQAFTHLALISAAVNLDRALDR